MAKQYGNEENLAYVDNALLFPRGCHNVQVTLHNGASITHGHANIGANCKISVKVFVNISVWKQNTTVC